MAPSRVSPEPAMNENDGTTAVGLTPKQLASFQRDGYLIVPDYLSQSTCKTLLDRTHELLTEFDLTNHPMTKFVTGSQGEEGAAPAADDHKDGDESKAAKPRQEHVGDEYFLGSGDKVRFFFEEDAFDTRTGELNKAKERAINKIGHNLHGLVAEFAAVSHAGATGKKNAAIAKQLGYTDPRLLQSMVICKQPEIGGAVPAHQDSTFLYTRRPSAIGFWIALEDATVENGCLSFAPGSHRRAPIRERFVRKTDGCVGGVGTTGFETIPEHDSHGRWPRDFDLDQTQNQDGQTQKRDEGSDDRQEQEQYVLGEVTAGTLVLIHGNILHKSEKNLSQKGRIIYTFHLIEGQEHYDDRNWLQIPGGPAAFTKLDGSLD